MIELLVVVLIIGILAAVALPQYTRTVEKSKATEALTLGKNIVDSARRYFLANEIYPASFDELDITLPAEYEIQTDPTYLQSKNFEIELDSANINPSIRISRLDVNKQRVDYYIWWDMTGHYPTNNSRTCNIHARVINPNSDKGKSFCSSLGGSLTGSGVWSF